MEHAIKLLDSKKFCLTVDRFVEVWGNAELDEVERAVALNDLLEAAGGVGYTPRNENEKPMSPSHRNLEKKQFVNSQNSIEIVDSDELTPSEQSKYLAEAEALRISTLSQEATLNEYISKELLPLWQRGRRNFCVPLRYHKRHLSTSNDRWKACLEMSGIQSKNLEFVYDEKTWVGDIPVPGVSIPLTIR